MGKNPNFWQHSECGKGRFRYLVIEKLHFALVIMAAGIIGSSNWTLGKISVLFGRVVCVSSRPLVKFIYLLAINNEVINGKFTIEERIFLLVSYLRLDADYATIS